MKTYGFLNTLAFSLVISLATAISSSAQTLTRIYSFCSQSNCTDGMSPLGLLVQAPDGNFYGTTYQGGHGNPYPMGVVYKLTSSGALTVLANFSGEDGGGNPTRESYEAMMATSMESPLLAVTLPRAAERLSKSVPAEV